MPGYVGSLMAIPRGVAREYGAIMQALTFAACGDGFSGFNPGGSSCSSFHGISPWKSEQSIAEM